MSYGVSVSDVNGATIFDSSHPIELASYYFTCQGNTAFPSLPDWITGKDSRYAVSSFSRTNVAGAMYGYSTVNNNYTLAFPYDASKFMPNDSVMTVAGVEYTVTNRTILGAVAGANFSIDFTNATEYYHFDKDVTALRSVAAARAIVRYEEPNYGYSIYVRPLSASYSGQFGWAHVGANLMNPMMIYDSTGSTTNTFEVMVASSAKAWGAIADTRTAKFLGGMSNYAIACQTGQTERHTPSSPLVSTTTFDSRTRIAKMILAKGWGGGTDYSNSSFSLGSLSASSTKRWARLDSTQFVKIGGGNPIPRYSAKYQWSSNNSISIAWNSNGGGRFSLSDSYVTDLPFAVAEFGVGA